ncbi:MAG: hypothetical protein QHH75_04155 [Bacillota bacterium]|nr:hypothetical protein [Bacillota bacterium]
MQAQRPYGGCYLALDEEQLTAAESRQEVERNLVWCPPNSPEFPVLRPKGLPEMTGDSPEYR